MLHLEATICSKGVQFQDMANQVRRLKSVPSIESCAKGIPLRLYSSEPTLIPCALEPVIASAKRINDNEFRTPGNRTVDW